MTVATAIAIKQRKFWERDELEFSPPTPQLRQPQSLSELASPEAVMAELASINWAFTSDDTSYLAHDLHPYPAKFIPQIPANLIAALTLRGEVVWDPFGGSGTTALEALLLGRRAISTDANPLATLVTEAKCTALSPEQRRELIAQSVRIRTVADAKGTGNLLDVMRRRSPQIVPPIPNLLSWFSVTTVDELCYLRSEIDALSNRPCHSFASVVLSSIVVGVSFQDGETRYARRPHDLPPGRVLKTYCDALEASLRKHEPLEKLLGYRRPRVETLDAREAARRNIVDRESVDLIVTSPPYANTTDYHLYHRFRLFWLGYDPRDFGRCEIGSHLRHQRECKGFELYREEMNQALEAISSRLRPGRYAVFVLGDSVFNGRTISTSSEISEVAIKQGFEVVGMLRRKVHSTRRSFIPPARRARTEDIVVFRKPPRKLFLRFYPPAYKTWPYEEELRRQEIDVLVGSQTARLRNGALVGNLDCYRVDKAQLLTFTSRVEEESGVPRWNTWQALLENGDSETARKDPKYLTHGIHSYKGKFYPQLAKSLLNLADLRAGSTVLDPFCGSGTVLLEAQLNGFVAEGVDLNPLAVLISRAKIGVATDSVVILDRLLEDFYHRILQDQSSPSDSAYFPVDLRPEIFRWFPAPVVSKLGWVLGMADKTPHASTNLILKVLISSVVREVSQQAPEDLRIRLRKKQIEDAPVLGILSERIASFRKRLQVFGERMSSAPRPFNPGNVVEGDSRSRECFAGMATVPFDCIVTSPPYATALPYIDTDRLSLLLLFGLASGTRARIEERLTGSREIRERERHLFESFIGRDLEDKLGSRTAARTIRTIHSLNCYAKVGFRRRNVASLLVRYFADMWSTFQNLSRVVKKGSQLFFVIGDNRTMAAGEEILIPSGKALLEMGRTIGWRLRRCLPITVTRQAPLHSRNAITENVILQFEAQ